jgi:hypothetical protein
VTRKWSTTAGSILNRRKRAAVPDRPPFTPDEDEALREIMALGLSSEFWHLALPERTHNEICTRRLDLGVRCAPLL